MEIGEACALADIDQIKPECNPPGVDPTNWKAVIDSIKGGEGSAAVLLENMDEAPPDYPSKKVGLADLFECDSSTFPCQTHHLIPEKQLPSHHITAWLTDSPQEKCKDKDYKLASDTNYDTNGEMNGLYMPFASTTFQWEKKIAKRNAVCFEMMRRAKIQLHQGPHSGSKDYSEDPNLELFTPYKKQVEEFLEEVRRVVRTHVDSCDVCKKNGKQEVVPLLSTVAMVEQVSSLMAVLISRGTVVVSGRAGAYRNKYAPAGKGYKHPAKQFVTPNDFE
jgi:hypothetical protein